MAGNSLQDGIDRAGSPVGLLWRQERLIWKGPVLADEITGWPAEQSAAFETASLSDLSHHMRDLWIEGPEATKLLSDYTANDCENFAVGQAKQLVPVTEQGWLIRDGIIFRKGESSYVLTGVPTAGSWLQYQSQNGNYRVEFLDDPSSDHRQGDPVLFRYQIQGPNALEIASRAFGGPLPQTKFFRSTDVDLDGCQFKALRHGMSGQAGYEFFGEFADGERVYSALMEAGRDLGLVEVGALAYATNAVESGWVAAPMPGIYSDPALEAYRQWLSLFSMEGQWGIYGSFFSPNIEDYYVSPYELGYGRSISFNHDFLGRDALEQASREGVKRTKVTLEIDGSEVRDQFGDDDKYMMDNGWHRIEIDGRLVGQAVHGARVARLKKLLWLSLVENEYATPGTNVEIVFGNHPGAGTDPTADLGFPRIRATVHEAPYSAYSRSTYRADPVPESR
jgi:vanillate/3-O-methylgallate O-demethylase